MVGGVGVVVLGLGPRAALETHCDEILRRDAKIAELAGDLANGSKAFYKATQKFAETERRMQALLKKKVESMNVPAAGGRVTASGECGGSDRGVNGLGIREDLNDMGENEAVAGVDTTSPWRTFPFPCAETTSGLLVYRTQTPYGVPSASVVQFLRQGGAAQGATERATNRGGTNRGGTLSDIGDVTIVEAPPVAMGSPQKFPEQSYPVISERDDEWRRRVRTMWRVNTVRVKELKALTGTLNDTLDDALTHTTTSDHCVGPHRAVVSGEEGAEVDVSGDRRGWGEEAYGIKWGESPRVRLVSP
eukprot:g15140.t1